MAIQELKPDILGILGEGILAKELTLDQLKINEIIRFLNKLDDRIELVEKKIKECETKVYG